MTATSIEWAEEVWNPTTGCTPVGEGCRNCYAMKEAWKLAGNPNFKIQKAYQGLTMGSASGPKWTGKINLLPGRLEEPLHWKKPRRVFVDSMSDLFHEKVPFEYVDRVFAMMALAQQHTFIVLTKRPKRMREFVKARCMALDPSPNIWMGFSAWDQESFEKGYVELAHTPAAVRVVSLEPLLGPIDLMNCQGEDHHFNALAGEAWDDENGDLTDDLKYARLDWVITGGESGKNARPSHPDWFRSLRDQCQKAGAAFFFKQWGRWRPLLRTDSPGRGECGMFLPDMVTGENHFRLGSPQVGYEVMYDAGKKDSGRLLDGREWNEMPGTAEPATMRREATP